MLQSRTVLRSSALLAVAALLALLAGCFTSSSSGSNGVDAGDDSMNVFDSATPEDATADVTLDTAAPEAAVDSATHDASDASVKDAAPEAGALDAQETDSSVPADTGAADGTVETGVPPMITSFTVSPSVIPVGSTRTVTLSWTVTGATSLSISGIGAVTGTSTTTSVSAATTFKLTATSGTGGVATATAAVSLAPGLYVDATNGSDTTGTGTAAAPYKTIAKVGSVAMSGQTIYAVAGTYPMQTAAVNLADNVGLEAITYGAVTLSCAAGSSYGLTFQGSGFLHGVVMSGPYTNVSLGTVTIDGVQFSQFPDTGSSTSSGINVTGTGHAIVTPGGVANTLGAAVSSFAYVGGGLLELRSLVLNSAGANVYDGSALISAQTNGQVLLDGVTMANGLTSAIVTGGTPTVTLQNGTSIHAMAGHGGSAWSLNVNNGSPTFLIDNSTITASPASGFYINGGSSPSITFQNGAALTGSAGIGIYFQGGPSNNGSLTLNNASISNNGGYGIDIGGGITSLFFRNSQITGNTNDGLIISANEGSLVDLGTAASPGGNSISGNAATMPSSSNLILYGSPSTMNQVFHAVGNTWDPTANGADGTGHFPAGTTFVAPPNVNGKNLQMSSSSGTYTVSLVATP